MQGKTDPLIFKITNPVFCHFAKDGVIIVSENYRQPLVMIFFVKNKIE